MIRVSPIWVFKAPPKSARGGEWSAVATVILVVLASLATVVLVVTPAHASATASALEPRSLARAQAIRTQLDARYRSMPGRGLAVTEASPTGVVESFTLLTPDLLETRVLAADNGIYFAVCPVRATCPYPARRLARPAADLAPRRLALELALRTFIETSANLVVVSLPTPSFSVFIVQRSELAREVEMPTLARTLRRDPVGGLSASLEGIVDRVTRPRVFRFLALEPTASGRTSWVGLPRWPTVT